MIDWGKKIDEALKQKQQESEMKEQKETENMEAKEANRQRAISFISEVVVPAFAQAEKILHKRNMFAQSNRSPDGTALLMEVHKQGELILSNQQKFTYGIAMDYDPFRITLTVECSSVRNHNIEKDGCKLDVSEINEEIICDDVMECFLAFIKDGSDTSPIRQTTRRIQRPRRIQRKNRGNT